MPFLIDTIAAQIVKTGPATSAELAKALDVLPVQVTDALRKFATQQRYGVFVAKKIQGSGGLPTNVWGIDVEVYKAYTATKGVKAKPRAIKVAPKPKVRAPKVTKLPKEVYRPAAEAPVYSGPSLTRWQSSSPYYAEAA